jgi:eukaryotic-like serine/threonine-protein kinase
MESPNLTVEDVRKILDNQESISDLEFLNKGGQKQVFKCKINDNYYTLKFLELSDWTNSGDLSETHDIQSEILARATREIDIMRKCNTPTLVKLGPIGMTLIEYNEKKFLYFSEEFIEGENLYQILNTRTLSQIEAIQLGIDITIAIEHLWSIGMVHRDIKPKNIMRKMDGTFVLLDTGIAFDTQGKALTQAFHIVGTKIYMSPEQLANIKASLDFRSDLYLLGIVLYESLTGRHPFFTPDINSVQLVSRVINSQYVPISQLYKDIHPKLEKLINRLLSVQPHLRYRSCSSLIQQLKQIREEL